MGRRARAKRERRRSGHGGPNDPVVGFVAVNQVSALCDGDALIVAGSRAALEALLARSPGPRWDIQPARFGHIRHCMQLGGAYGFDEAAYRAFLPHACRAGLALQDEDFSEPGPTGLHFVRVQIAPILPLDS